MPGDQARRGAVHATRQAAGRVLLGALPRERRRAPEDGLPRRQVEARQGDPGPQAEIRDLKREIQAVIADVKAGDLDRNDAGVMLQGYRTLKDYIALERDVSILPELEERLKELKNERPDAS